MHQKIQKQQMHGNQLVYQKKELLSCKKVKIGGAQQEKQDLADQIQKCFTGRITQNPLPKNLITKMKTGWKSGTMF
mgnify:CR=1 FL=1